MLPPLVLVAFFFATASGTNVSKLVCLSKAFASLILGPKPAVLTTHAAHESAAAIDTSILTLFCGFDFSVRVTRAAAGAGHLVFAVG